MSEPTPDPGEAPTPVPAPGGAEVWPEPPRTSALAIVALIVGVISMPAACCCGLFSLPVSIMGVVLSSLALVQFRGAAPGELKGKELAIVGLVASSLGILLFIVVIVFGVGSNYLTDVQRGF